MTLLEIDVGGALLTLYRDRLCELRADSEAADWGGLRHEAALEVLGCNATFETINALLVAASAGP